MLETIESHNARIRDAMGLSQSQSWSWDHWRVLGEEYLDPTEPDRPMPQSAIEAGYTELFWQESRWWGFPPGGIMPEPLDQFG